MKVLNIQTTDGEISKVEWDVARQSKTIKELLDNLGIQEDSTNEDTIPIPNGEVTGEIFKPCLVWMEKNRGKTDFQRDHNEMTDWEKEYVNMPVSQMFPILIAGNFLEIEGLIDLMTSALALQIQNNDVVEIRKIFDIEDPQWTPEELQKLKEENAWAYEQKSK